MNSILRHCIRLPQWGCESVAMMSKRPLAFTSTWNRTPTDTRSFATENTQQSDDRDRMINPVYIHHVSKIALQHLQDSRYEWLQQQGLDKGLRIKSDGTFVLEFPARKGFDAGRIWYAIQQSERS